MLLRMRTQDWLPAPRDLLNVPPDQAIYGVVWLLAITCVGWLALSSVLSVIAYATRLPGAIRAVEWMTIPPIRRLARRSAALVLALGSLTMTSPAGATQAPPIPHRVAGAQPVAVVMVDSERNCPVVPSGIGVVVPMPVVVDPAFAGPGAGANGEPATSLPEQSQPASLAEGCGGSPDTISYTVRSGDNLWSISANHLRGQTDRAPSAAEIRPIWREVIELNRDRIRSGDPNLIYPGEELFLPRIEQV